MKKWILRIVFVLLLVVFVISVGSITSVLYQYYQGDVTYDDAVSRFVRPQIDPESQQPEDPSKSPGLDPLPDAALGGHVMESDEGISRVIAPLVVDFESLKAVNEDVVGWIYCEDSLINYPLLHGADNDLYLHHLYDKTYSFNGSIFVEAANRRGFLDANTIIYGHNMRNSAMFGTLDNWSNQTFFDEHPVFWILTPERDYMVQLFAGYTTNAYSDTYLIYSDGCEEFDEYLARAVELSDVVSDVTLESDAKYVLLSTCAYLFDNARFVLHGKLVPADSAGGILKTG